MFPCKYVKNVKNTVENLHGCFWMFVLIYSPFWLSKYYYWIIEFFHNYGIELFIPLCYRSTCFL